MKIQDSTNPSNAVQARKKLKTFLPSQKMPETNWGKEKQFTKEKKDKRNKVNYILFRNLQTRRNIKEKKRIS